MTKHIHLAISGHGFGHLSQITAVTNCLLANSPTLQVSIQSSVREHDITQFINSSFIYNETQLDVGMVQLNPLQVDNNASFASYKQFHQQYDIKLQQQKDCLARLQPDLILADIPYLTIQAASELKIPTIAIASLTWDYIVESYFDSTNALVKSWLATIQHAYSLTETALLPAPAMPARNFTLTRPIEPIINRGVKVPDLRTKLSISNNDNRPLVLCSLGGINNAPIPIKSLSAQTDFHWLVVNGFSDSDNVHCIQHCNIPYRNLLASVDAMVGKPGYGMAVEAIAHNIPFVFARRGDFPDEPFIIEWLTNNGRTMEIPITQWLKGDFTKALQQLLAATKPAHVSCHGASQAANIIAQHL